VPSETVLVLFVELPLGAGTVSFEVVVLFETVTFVALQGNMYTGIVKMILDRRVSVELVLFPVWLVEITEGLGTVSLHDGTVVFVVTVELTTTIVLFVIVEFTETVVLSVFWGRIVSACLFVLVVVVVVVSDEDESELDEEVEFDDEDESELDEEDEEVVVVVVEFVVVVVEGEGTSFEVEFDELEEDAEGEGTFKDELEEEDEEGEGTFEDELEEEGEGTFDDELYEEDEEGEGTVDDWFVDVSFWHSTICVSFTIWARDALHQVVLTPAP